MSGIDDALRAAAARAAEHLHGRTLALAESCTGGLVTQAFAAVEGSGEWLRGGLIAYQREAKVDLLGVDPAAPLVSAGVAEQMARGVARAMRAEVAVAITGAAGPDGLDGMPPGAVVITVLVDDEVETIEIDYDDPEPSAVIERAAHDALALVTDALVRGCRGSCGDRAGTSTGHTDRR